MLRAALRRLALLLACTAGGTAAISAVVGLLLGSSLSRSVSVGLYLVGCFLLVSGFFVGNRGPARLRGGDAEGSGAMGGMFGLGIGTRRVRWATLEEREEAISNSAIFVTLGLALILLGVLADTRVELV